jgi:hypothetical protein
MKLYGCLIAMACALTAQPASSYRYTVKGDEKTIEITNVNYQVASPDRVLWWCA